MRGRFLDVLVNKQAGRDGGGDKAPEVGRLPTLVAHSFFGLLPTGHRGTALQPRSRQLPRISAEQNEAIRGEKISRRGQGPADVQKNTDSDDR